MVYRKYSNPKLPAWNKDKGEVLNPHVVILGAGASRQAFLHGDRNGLRLPVMRDFAPIVGLDAVLEQYGIKDKTGNFEALYDGLVTSGENPDLLSQIEQTVDGYFSKMRLPEEPTLYDYLVTSLRGKDLIATFNWDPLLYQAIKRNLWIGRENLPQIVYLHGNVALGICYNCKTVSDASALCFQCDSPLERCRLLYPVQHKNYTDEPFIKNQWDRLRVHLERACLVTIFGYSAPVTDVEARQLMLEVWENNPHFELAQFDIIDIQSMEALEKSWDDFTFSHHWDRYEAALDSFLFKFPRRSCEAYFEQYLNAQFIDHQPYPTFTTLYEMKDWFSRYHLPEERVCTYENGKLTLRPETEETAI